MNPSVTTHKGALVCNVRCVNYRINEHGQYIIKASDGTANAENPINTRNFLLYLGMDPHTPTHPGVTEILAPLDLPCKFPLVVGFEDMRLFSWNGDLWTSSTVRQIHEDGNCEQVLARLGDWHADHYQLTDVRRMLRTPRGTEKNWSPMLCGRNENTLEFMWRPGEIVNLDGKTVNKHDTGMATDHISGSSQLIPWGNGYLSIVHEARALPGESYKRYYYHRFAEYTYDGRLKCLSLPFVFQDRAIEFCAGLTRSPNALDLVISYGYKDEQAMIATVSEDEVQAFLVV